MNTIVYAAIAILVLLVIILIFTSNMKKPAGEVKGVNEGKGGILEDIGGKMGDCGSNCQEKCPNGIDSFKTCPSGLVCCVN